MVSAEKPQCHTHFVRVTMCFPSRPGRRNIRPGIGKTVKAEFYTRWKAAAAWLLFVCQNDRQAA